MNEKEILRKSILNALKTMTDDELEQRAEPLYERFMQQPIIQDAKTVALTISMAHELPTRPLIEKLWSLSKTIVVPRVSCSKARLMDFYILSSFENLVTSSFGVLEPDLTTAKQIDKALIDVTVVPGVAFNNKGYRIGYGGGYYDTFLEKYPSIATISLLYDFQLHQKVHEEPHDQRVDYLIIEGDNG